MKRALVFIAGLAVGFISAYLLLPKKEIIQPKAIRENNSNYTFIEPLLAVGRSDTKIPSPEFAELADKVTTLISRQKKNGSIEDVSVYFSSYGENQGFFSINEGNVYTPASLLKVVLMMGYLKKADTDPAILKQKYMYKPEVADSLASLQFQAPTSLKVGSSYTVEDLINTMIIDSDNGPMNLLLAHMDDAYLSQVYTDLGLQFPEVDAQYLISAKEYSLFLRILFNATYLSKNNSEKALALLSKTTFNDGLVKGLPKNIVVAHKFGEHVEVVGDKINSVELHDCGYVYAAKNPYLLCVMTKGKELADLSATIGAISKLVYADISNR